VQLRGSERPAVGDQEQPAPPDPVLVGAGDIADCSEIESARKTAQLIEKIEGTVFTLGDNAYGSGSAAQFEKCYGPTWGRFKNRTRPAPGNHDYRTLGAAPYFAYFGEAAGDPKKGYYSYDLGTWHIIVVNSNCRDVGGCRKGSPQEQWLREDLAVARVGLDVHAENAMAAGFGGLHLFFGALIARRHGG